MSQINTQALNGLDQMIQQFIEDNPPPPVNDVASGNAAIYHMKQLERVLLSELGQGTDAINDRKIAIAKQIEKYFDS